MMSITEISTKWLFLAATVSIALLLFSSDFSPPRSQGFRDAQLADRDVEVRCAVLGCNESAKGLTMELLDTEGMEVRGFCAKGRYEEVPLAGTIIDATCQPSSGDKTFFFVSSFRSVS